MFAVVFKPSAQKELERLPAAVVKKIAAVIEQLALTPRLRGAKKLKGQSENLWRIRVGDYQIVYLIADQIQLLEIRKIGHRKDVYRF